MDLQELSKWIPSSQDGVLPSWLQKIDEQVKQLGSSSSWQERMNVSMMSSVALPLFGLIDETYQLTAAVLKIPFVALKETVARPLGFKDTIPDTLGVVDWMGHAQKIFQYALLIFTAVLGAPLEFYSPGFVLQIAKRIGLVPAPSPQLQPAVVARRSSSDEDLIQGPTETSL